MDMQWKDCTVKSIAVDITGGSNSCSELGASSFIAVQCFCPFQFTISIEVEINFAFVPRSIAHLRTEAVLRSADQQFRFPVFG